MLNVISVMDAFLEIFLKTSEPLSQKHTFQPISYKICDNGPPGSVTKILENHTFRNPVFWEMHFQL